MDKIKVAFIGLDSSHSVELSRLVCSPDQPAEQKIEGLTVTACLRFETPFQNKEGLDKRQAQLEAWGIKVTEDFDEAIADCDAIQVEINDPAYHLEYFQRVAALGKPIFLDKPLAGTLEDGREILRLARKHQTRVFSSSSLPLFPAVGAAVDKLAALGEPVLFGHTFGALGKASAGDSLIWYGVHSFEMLQRVMGCGAERVFAIDNGQSVVSTIEYSGNRRGVVESTRSSWRYGGRVQSEKNVEFFLVNGPLYYYLMKEIRAFFQGGPAPVSMEQTFEGLAMMVAASKSIATGKAVEVEKF